MLDKGLLSARQMNRLKVIEALYRRPGSSRTEVAEYTGLSRPTVSMLLEELERAGIVRQHDADGSRPRGTGRPPVLVSLVPRAAFAVGLDVGHEHVRAAVCDLSGEILADDYSTAEVDHAPTESLDLARELVHGVLREADVTADAARSPGRPARPGSWAGSYLSFWPSGGVAAAGAPARRCSAHRLRGRPVRRPEALTGR